MSATRRDATYVFAGEIIQRGSQAVTFFVLAGILSPREYGLAAVATVALAAIALLFMLGLGSAAIALGANAARDQTALGGGLFLGVTGFACLQAVAGPVAGLLGAAEAEALVRSVAVVLLVQPYTDVRNSLLERDSRFRLTATAQGLGAVLGAMGAVALALAGAGGLALVAQVVIMQVTRLAILASVRHGERRPAFHRAEMGALWRYSRELLASQALLTAFFNADNAVVGRLAGATQLGLYTFAFSLANLPVLVIAHSASRLLFPRYARQVHADEPLLPLYDVTLRLTTWVSALPFFALAINGPLLLDLLYGTTRWEGAYRAFQMLCLYGFLRSAGVAPGTVFNALKHPDVNRRILQWQVLAFVVVAPATMLGGIEGTAAAVTALVLGGVAWSLSRCDRRLGRAGFAGIRTTAGAGIMTGAVCLVARSLAYPLGNGWGSLVLSSALAVTGWAAAGAYVNRKHLRRVGR